MARNPKPLLGPCDSYQLEPFAYEWAWAMARAQEHNNWAPEEIAVAPDVADWKDPDLDPRFRHLFQSVMAQLTTFDIERGDDAAETFLSVFQPAEIRHFLKRLVWEEGLHTRSYRYVIENLGIPLSIYDTWQTVPAMKARVEMAQDISKPIERLVGERLRYGRGYDEWTDREKGAFLRALVFWFLIFEGVWFWVSLLGPVQQLARLGRFKGGAEQFTYIARDEQQHIGFGIALIREFMAQYPEALLGDTKDLITQDARRAMALEGEYIAYCLKDGPILGYTAEDHLSTAKFFANLRLGAVGLEPPFGYGAAHAFPWMSEQMELKKEKNFFETRVTEYQTGGALAFDSDPEPSAWVSNGGADAAGGAATGQVGGLAFDLDPSPAGGLDWADPLRGGAGKSSGIALAAAAVAEVGPAASSGFGAGRVKLGDL
jgi:ribonucleoside-diphosphate reductase beta chain